MVRIVNEALPEPAGGATPGQGWLLPTTTVVAGTASLIYASYCGNRFSAANAIIGFRHK